MFEMIHEFAVLGTACFMMALTTVWYSPMLFGKVWMKETGVTDDMITIANSDMWKHMIITFVSYVVMLAILALMVVHAPKVGITPIQAALIMVGFVAATAVAPSLYEGKTYRYYCIRVGFYLVFIIVGTLMLQYWPW